MVKATTTAKVRAAKKPAPAAAAPVEQAAPAQPAPAEIEGQAPAAPAAAPVAEAAPALEPQPAPAVTEVAQEAAPGAPAAEAVPAAPEPEAPVEPEVAAPPTAGGETGPAFLVTGPERGFRRAGFAFGREARVLTPADFGVAPNEEATAEQLERLLSVLTEPALRVTVRGPDGEIEPVVPEVIEAMRLALERRRAGADA